MAEGPPSPADPLRRVRRIGYLVLGFQLAAFLAWSGILYSRFAVTSDFSTYNQPWYLVAHGHLDPFSTISNIPFWQNDAEFMPWVLAPFYWIFRGIALPWLQDISVAGAEVVVFAWMCEIAERRLPAREARWAVCLGLLLLVADPWIWWAISFDVHEEVFVIIFTVLLARDVMHSRRRAWLWAALVMAGGAPSATYVIGIGIGGVIATRRLRSQGALLAIAAVVYSGLIVAVHGDVGVPLARHYGQLVSDGGAIPAGLTVGSLLKGIAAHPQNVLEALRQKFSDIVANLAPAGLIGLGAPVLMPLLLVVLLANTLSGGYQFSEPLFQSLPIYVLLPLGTVMVLASIARRHRRVAVLLGGFLAVQAVGWAVVWGSQTPGEWLRVPGSTAATLDAIEAGIPSSAEVVVSQGVAGRFSNRTHIYTLFGASPIPLHGKTWFIITPQEGIEPLSPSITKTLVGELEGPLHATLITHANGVWAFVWNPPSAMHRLDVPGNLSPVPAWTSVGVEGRAVLTGPEANWHVTSTGGRGYVVDQLEWQAPPGRYDAAVTLLTSGGTVNVEVWDDTSGGLLARRTVLPTDGIQTISMPVDATIPYQAKVYAGWGPFRADFTSPPPGERLEVRVWSPGGTLADVYSADLTSDSSGSL
jgi:hypothetical protein